MKLTISGHTAQWWWQANKAPYTNCSSSAVPANRAYKTISYLTGDTAYTFSAYSDSGCNTLLATAREFTTLPPTFKVIQAHISENRAGLVIDGSADSWFFKADSAPHHICALGGTRYLPFRTVLNLLPKTAYTFSAYSDSGCNTLLATGETFTIRQLEPLPQCDGITMQQEFTNISRAGSAGAWSDVFISNETDLPIRNVGIELFRLEKGLTSASYKNSLSRDELRIGPFNPEGSAPGIQYTVQGIASTGAPSTNPNTIIFDVTEIPANSTYKIRYQSSSVGRLTELNAVLTVSSGGDAPVTLCRSHDSTWMYSTPHNVGYNAATSYTPSFRMTVDDPLPATGGTVNFKISIMEMYGAVIQSCVKLDFSSGLSITLDANNKPNVTYTPANGTGDVMEYDGNGTDNYKRGYTTVSDHNPHYRWGLCSGADGKFSGGIYHIGYWDRYKETPNKTSLDFTVPFTVTLSSEAKLSDQCVTATFRYLPSGSLPSESDYQEKTSTICLGVQPAEEPPVLLRDGRADIITLYQCASGDVASGGFLPCQGKTADDLALYVDASRLALEDAKTTDDIDASGSAAARAGADYRLFRPEDVVIHVPDQAARRLRVVTDLPTYPAGNVWYSGNDNADDPDDNNDFGYIAGVSTRLKVLTGGGTYPKLWVSMCPDAATSPTKTLPCTTGANTNPGTLRGFAELGRSFVMYDMAATQPARNYTGNWSFLTRDIGLTSMLEFSELGTYEQDIVVVAGPDDTVGPWTDAAGRYTFHVGPAADLGVGFGGSVPAGSKRAFTVVAASDATGDVQPAPLAVGNKGAWKALRPEVTVTAGNGKAPANVTLAHIGLGSYSSDSSSYDKKTGVWTLPEGFHGVATLTLVADAPEAGSPARAKKTAIGT